LGLLLLSVLLVGGFFSPVLADPEVTGGAWTGLVAIFVLGLLWPIAALVVVQVRVCAAPTDAMVGRPFDLDVELGGIGGGVDLRVLGRGQPWRSADVPDRVALPVTLTSRGLFDEVVAEVQLSGPLGIVRARRRVALRLPRSLWVAPAPTAEQWVPDATILGEASGQSSRASLMGDAVRSTRPYRAGDPAHLVHWPSVARTGSLVVRELEPPAGVGLAIVVSLTGQADRDEVALSRASGLMRAIHATGGRVVFCTHDERGPHTTALGSLIEGDRLLALASPGPPGPVPPGWPVVAVPS
jgi:uncharacterized protein (DUF58 family)